MSRVQANGLAAENSVNGIVVDCYLGIDPGLRRTGYAILQRSTNGPLLREAGVIRSNAKQTLAQRVLEIGNGLEEILEEFHPQVLAVEQVFSLGRNPKSALLVAHARGAVLITVARKHIPVIHYSATQIKRLLTGSGRASKAQIQFAVKNELRLDEVPEPNDVADAAAVALCAYHSIRTAV